MSNYPFFYFPNLEFDASKLLEFVNSLPDNHWIGPHIGNYDKSIPITPHRADGLLWTANNQLSDFTASDEINKIANYFTKDSTPLYFAMTIKKSKNGFRSPFHPLMQNAEFDKKNNVVRTYDIIVPIQGGFKESPLEAIDTKTNEHFTLVPKGQAFMVPCDTSWHYSWCETVCDWRYTLHLRGKVPFTYELMKEFYTV